jgi:hypothetical protein
VPALRDFDPPPLDGFLEAEALRAAPLRDEPELADLARLAPDLLLLLFEPEAVDREPDDFARELDDFEREPLDLRAPLDFLAVLPRLDPDEEPELPPELPLALPSIDHLPVITRCAASATASAISEPNLVALAITLVAACDAVSAASSPASRIARRAFGLALIAAAAAARPAASISLLIAALASLSTVSLLLLLPLDDVLFEEREVLLRADLAIALFLRSRKDTSRL